ncbi:ATP-dependent helicase [Ruminococcus sp. HUN007]|uniref:ATP-dependent helicase n=1 Tax=Ruminococcus sp. HUN007 TaxID=1514668 RepID=UPI000678637F|nr:ATP-dependent helicase [Ruminococcus sp. HUN007]
MEFTEFRKKYNITLNPQQESAVTRADGQTLLLAVPGSGKTTVIVARLGYMLYCKGVKPENILTMTYNVSAAADMKKRFFDKFGCEFEGRIEFRTINGFCAKVIMMYERTRNTSAFSLLDEGKVTKIIKALYVNMTREFPSESTVKELKTKLIYCRNMMLKPDEIRKIKVGEIDFYSFFTAYRNYKSENRVMDFDDQLEFALKILLKNQDILTYCQNRFRYISIDEAQDTSKIQHMIIRLLASRYKNIFMVGDEDQSIYGFRAAYPQALLEFNTVYPEGKVLLMEQNYRSSADIVNKANSFIKQNRCRHDKNMFTENPAGLPVRRIVLKDCKYQYSYIQKMTEDSDDELAVLYRNNESALPIIDIFEKNGIGYRLKENDGVFFSVNCIYDILSILQFAFAPWDAALFLEFYYKIGLKIKKDIVTRSLVKHKNSNISFFRTLEKDDGLEKWHYKLLKETEHNFNHLRKLNSFSAITFILSKMEYGKFMKSRGLDETKVKTLLALANQNPDLSLFLARMTELKNIVTNGSSDPDSKIILSTIHSSKGLEYDNVLLIDVRDGIMPSSSVCGEDEEDMTESQRNDLEEERRLFYVGVTRAKHSLAIFDYEAAYGVKNETAAFTRQLFGIETDKKKKSQKSEKTSTLKIKAPSAADKAKVRKKEEDALKVLKKYKPGTRINHRVYGTGVIEEIKAPICRVLIDGGDIHSFDIVYCISNDIVSIAK